VGAVELEAQVPGFMGVYSPTLELAHVLLYSDRFDESRELLLGVLERCVAFGDEEARAQVLFHLGDLERRAGNWRQAERWATEASELWRQGGNEQEYASSLALVGGLDALTGRLDAARERATYGLQAAERMGDETFAVHHRGVLGLVELSAGDPAAAQRWLQPAVDRLIATGVGEVSIYPAFQYEIDALVAVGRLDRAERLVAHLEALAARTGRTWTRAVAARGRGLLRAAAGDPDYMACACIAIAREVGDKMLERRPINTEAAAEFAVTMILGGLKALPRADA
jgi:tetratricopeptide (TPR) repeat protein